MCVFSNCLFWLLGPDKFEWWWLLVWPNIRTSLATAVSRPGTWDTVIWSPATPTPFPQIFSSNWAWIFCPNQYKINYFFRVQSNSSILWMNKDYLGRQDKLKFEQVYVNCKILVCPAAVSNISWYCQTLTGQWDLGVRTLSQHCHQLRLSSSSQNDDHLLIRSSHDANIPPSSCMEAVLTLWIWFMETSVICNQHSISIIRVFHAWFTLTFSALIVENKILLWNWR